MPPGPRRVGWRGTGGRGTGLARSGRTAARPRQGEPGPRTGERCWEGLLDRFQEGFEPRLGSAHIEIVNVVAHQKFVHFLVRDVLLGGRHDGGNAINYLKKDMVVDSEAFDVHSRD